MRTSTFDSLIDHLRALGLGPTDTLAVHSKLIAFGRIEGGVDTVLAALRQVVGAGATLVVPTYVFTQDDGAVFDPRTTPSQGMGALAEAVRTHPGARRSRCPIHSHAVLGPRSDILDEANPTRTMGPGSDFDQLDRAGARLLLLGLEYAEGATFLHHLEAVAAVPYRSWVDVPRRVVTASGATETLTVRHYARSESHWVTDLARAGTLMAAAGADRRAAAPYGVSVLCDLPVLRRVVLAALATDPYALMRPADGPGQHS